MKKAIKKFTSLLLAVALCLCLLPAGGALAAGDAMNLDQVKALMNAEPLYPQKTGYVELDRELDKLLAPYEGKDTYTKLKGLYEWTVNEIEYSWDGYSQEWAPAYDKFTLKYDLTHEEGAPQVYPMDMIYRAYHALTAKKSVCYDWGILYAVMARYVGIESWVHTGILDILDISWAGHHGWTELRLGGKDYIFDAQQDNRSKRLNNGVITYEHFGIPPERMYRYHHEAANGPRDESLLSPSVQVTVQASHSGAIEGAGRFARGQEVTLSVLGDTPLTGWYTPTGELLSQEPVYTLTPQKDVKLLAMFEGDYFIDVSADSWYGQEVNTVAERGLFAGVNPVTFAPDRKMTRAMMVSLLARLDGADLSTAGASPFEDVDPDSWYGGAVTWAYESGYVYGVAPDRFDPNGVVTREQTAAMLMRYLEKWGVSAGEAEGSFADSESISSYAVEYVSAAQALGILTGYSDGTVRPKDQVTRAQGAVMAARTLTVLDAA